MTTLLLSRLTDDADVMERLTFNSYYDSNRLINPRFTAMWSDVPQSERDHATKVGLEIAAVLVTRPEITDLRLNVHTYETLECDEAFGLVLGRIAYLAISGESEDALFSAWEALGTESQAAYTRFGYRVLAALITDYTTPGCKCRFCIDPPTIGDTHGKPIMCQQRWDALPINTRIEISDSMEG
jgi:hypothetical protein